MLIITQVIEDIYINLLIFSTFTHNILSLYKHFYDGNANSLDMKTFNQAYVKILLINSVAFLLYLSIDVLFLFV